MPETAPPRPRHSRWVYAATVLGTAAFGQRPLLEPSGTVGVLRHLAGVADRAEAAGVGGVNVPRPRSVHRAGELQHFRPRPLRRVHAVAQELLVGGVEVLVRAL